MECHEETMSDSKHEGIPQGNYEWRKGWWNAMRKLWVTQRIMECNRRKRRNSFSWEKCMYSSISSAWQFDDEDHYFSKCLHTSISVRWISRSADVPSENLRPPGKREQNTSKLLWYLWLWNSEKKKWNIKVEHYSFTNSINFIHEDDTRFMISCIAWKKNMTDHKITNFKYKTEKSDQLLITKSLWTYIPNISLISLALSPMYLSTIALETT